MPWRKKQRHILIQNRRRLHVILPPSGVELWAFIEAKYDPAAHWRDTPPIDHRGVKASQTPVTS